LVQFIWDESTTDNIKQTFPLRDKRLGKFSTLYFTDGSIREQLKVMEHSMDIKIVIFVLTPCSVVGDTEDSKEYAAFIFKVEVNGFNSNLLFTNCRARQLVSKR
jgi:hypothetical protein